MSSKKKILVIQPVHELGMKLLINNPNFDYETTNDISESNIKAKIANVDGVSVRTAILNKNIINEAKNLKIISRHGVGYDNIDLSKTKEKGIQLAITANANAVTVAEHVMFMLLNLSKKKDMYDKTVRSGNFTDRNKLPKTIELCGKNMLIAGFGRIGQSLIKRCLGFEMKVYVYDPFVDKKKIENLGGKKIESLNESVKEMDVISLHVPLNKNTKNLINYDLL